MTPDQLKRILEAALMVAGRSLTLADMQKLFDNSAQPSTQELREHLKVLQEQYAESGIELAELASGFRFQARAELSPWLSRLWEERAPRFGRAVLETLALIAYRQPITRAEIEDIRGVAVSTQIIKTLQDREWVKVVGHRDVPGKPELLATTKTFLDHLGLKSLEDLPPLSELIDLDKQEEKLQIQLELAADPKSDGDEEIDDENLDTDNSDDIEEIDEEDVEIEADDESEIDELEIEEVEDEDDHDSEDDESDIISDQLDDEETESTDQREKSVSESE